MSENDPTACTQCTCAAGHYCPVASSSAAGVPCGAGFACAGTTAQPLACVSPEGWYCPANSSAVGGVRCPVSYFCGGSSEMMPTQCGAGHYCPAGSSNATKCAAGFYGADQIPTYTTSSCTGACTFAVGFVCLPGSPTFGGTQCPAGFYSPNMTTVLPCRVRAAARVRCLHCHLVASRGAQALPGMACGAGSSASQGDTCSPGLYCTGGAAPAAVCLAPPGRFCGAGCAESLGTECQAGTFCTGANAQPGACAGLRACTCVVPS